jgi:hypothetical protein
LGQRSGYRMGEERRYGSLEEFVYEAVCERITLPKDEFMEQLRAWELRPVAQGDVIAAVVMVMGNEVHVAVKRGYRGRWMKRGSVIRGILAPILAEYGELTTSVSFGNDSGRAFVERIGFVPSSVIYRLEKLKHA